MISGRTKASRWLAFIFHIVLFVFSYLGVANAEEMSDMLNPNQMTDMDMIGAAMGMTQAKPGLLKSLLDSTFLADPLAHSKITLSGWTDLSYTASSANQSNLPLEFNYKANAFLLQQNWFRIDRAVDEKSDRLSWGFRSDWILPGSDYRFTLPRGIFNGQLTSNDGAPATYGIDPIQFYLEGRISDLSIVPLRVVEKS